MLGRVKLENSFLTCDQGNFNQITARSHNWILVTVVRDRCSTTVLLAPLVSHVVVVSHQMGRGRNPLNFSRGYASDISHGWADLGGNFPSWINLSTTLWYSCTSWWNFGISLCSANLNTQTKPCQRWYLTTTETTRLFSLFFFLFFLSRIIKVENCVISWADAKDCGW